MKSAGDAEKAAWETERAALVKRAEAAENQLKPVAEELSGLKHHISQMSAAIFGKLFRSSKLILSIQKHLCMPGDLNFVI